MSRDRGDTQADVLCGADPDRSYDWHPLEWVIAAASGSVPREPRTMRARQAAELVAEHGERLAAAVSGGAIGSTRDRLREFARERMRVMWGDEWLAAHEADLRAEGRDQSPS